VKTLLRSLALAASLGAFAASATAQGVFLEGVGGYQDLTSARNSAKAVFDGASGGFTWGGGIGFDMGNGLFISGWFRSFSKDGERVFVESPGGPVFRLGHPLTLKLRPIQGTLGYRFLRSSLVQPYIGIGAGVTSIKETSTVGGIGQESKQSKASFHALAGFELGRGSVGIGAEVMYLSVPNSIGVSGVSAVYGESNVGGFSAVGRIRLGARH
jgi:opacity protein-like surface antigen